MHVLLPSSCPLARDAKKISFNVSLLECRVEGTILQVTIDMKEVGDDASFSGSGEPFDRLGDDR